MKKIFYFLFLFFLSFACSSPQDKKSSDENNSSNFGVISKSIIETTKAYLSSQLKKPKIEVGTNSIKIWNEEMLYIVTTKDINIGLIDEDNTQDAIVSYLIVPTGKTKYRKHLLMLNKGEMKVVCDFISEMKVMQISNRIVYAEIPKYGANSPLHTCDKCMNNIQYKLAGDSLQLIKNTSPE